MKLINLFFKDLNFNDKKRIKKNLTSKLSQNFFLVFIQIFFPPAMITIYGIENYGIWLFIISLPSVISILNFNINSAAQIEMSILYNKKKYNELSIIFTNSVFLIIIFSVFITFSAFFLIKLDFFNFNLLSQFDEKEKQIIFILIFSSLILNILNGIFKSGINFKGNISSDTYFEIFFDLTGKILIITAGYLSNNLIISILILFLTNLLKIIFYFVFFINTQSKNLFYIKKISFFEIKRLFKLSVPYYLESISLFLKENYQIIIIGIFFNASLVGMVGTLKTMFFFLPLRIWSMLQQVLNYEITKLVASKQIIKIKKLFNKIFKLLITFILFFLLNIHLFGELFYNIWTNFLYKPDYLFIFYLSLETSIIILASSLKILGKSINEFFKVSLFTISIYFFNLLILINFFKNDYQILTLFILNLLMSIFILIFNFINFKLLLKKISNN